MQAQARPKCFTSAAEREARGARRAFRAVAARAHARQPKRLRAFAQGGAKGRTRSCEWGDSSPPRGNSLVPETSPPNQRRRSSAWSPEEDELEEPCRQVPALRDATTTWYVGHAWRRQCTTTAARRCTRPTVPCRRTSAPRSSTAPCTSCRGRRRDTPTRRRSSAGGLNGAFQRGRGGPGGWWILFEPELQLLAFEPMVPDLAGWRVERLPALPETAHFPIAPDWI